MVWRKTWQVLVIPTIALILVFATGLTNVVLEFLVFTYPPDKAYALIPILFRFAPTQWAITFVNIYCTALIVFKIWQICQSTTGQGTVKLVFPAVNALIECAALYTIITLCFDTRRTCFGSLLCGWRGLANRYRYCVNKHCSSVEPYWDSKSTRVHPGQNFSMSGTATVPCIGTEPFRDATKPRLRATEVAPDTSPEDVFCMADVRR